MSWTAILATWGAITGTVSILLQLRSFWRDRPSLVVSIKLDNLTDSRRRFEVLVVNRGRRPVFTDSLVFEFRKAVWRPARTLRTWREECRESETERELKENEGASFYPSEMLLEFDGDYSAVYRVGVKDKTGRTWWSSRSIGERALFEINAAYPLRSFEFPAGELSLDRDRTGYRLFNSSDESRPMRRFRFRWLGMRAFERAQRGLQSGQHLTVPQTALDPRAPNTGAAPDG